MYYQPLCVNTLEGRVKIATYTKPLMINPSYLRPYFILSRGNGKADLPVETNSAGVARFEEQTDTLYEAGALGVLKHST